MRVNYNIWLAYNQFQLDNSTTTWPEMSNILYPFHWQNQQKIQIQSGHCFHTQESYVTAIGPLIPAGLGIFAVISFGVDLPD